MRRLLAAGVPIDRMMSASAFLHPLSSGRHAISLLNAGKRAFAL
jgi:hypothetical protein